MYRIYYNHIEKQKTCYFLDIGDISPKKKNQLGREGRGQIVWDLYVFSSWYHNIVAVVYKILIFMPQQGNTDAIQWIYLPVLSFNCFKRDVLKFINQKREERKLAHTELYS